MELYQSLDIQYTVGLATNVPVIFASTGSITNDSEILDVVNFFLKQPSPPQVITTSYGFDEDMLSPSLMM